MEARITKNPYAILLQAVDDLRREVSAFRASTIEDLRREIAEFRVYSIADLAEKFGCCPRTLKNKLWNLPNFGRADVEPGIWMPGTVTKWYETPEDERRARWEGMTSIERRKAMGREV